MHSYSVKRAARLLSAFLVAALQVSCGGGESSNANSDHVQRSAASVSALAPASDLVSVSTITKVSEVRISRTIYEYTFKPTFKNDGSAVVAVEGKLLGVGAGTTIVDGTANVEAIPANATVAASDTITLRHDRSLPFNLGALVWRVRAIPADPPLIAGVKLYGIPVARAVVGQAYQGRVRVGAGDARNSIVALSVANATSGGALPTITVDGELTWLPKDADFATKSLKVCATQESSDKTCFDIPVWVTKFRTVAEITLSGAGGYADPSGRYIVEVTRTASAGAVGGTLTIDEQYDARGYFTARYTFSSAGNSVKVLKRPLPGVTPPLSEPTPQANRPQVLSARSQVSSLSLTHIDSILGSLVDVGVNLYSTRQDVPKVEGNSRTNFPQVEVARVESSCNTSLRGSCSGTKPPIILIHGFTPELLALGGGTGTWGELASTLRSRGHQVFELRWFTQMRFEEAAGLLVQLGRGVAEASGSKPYVIAHSFGGVVAHLALAGEGVVWDETNLHWQRQPMADDAERVFAGLVTLGSPLSGINESEKYTDLTVGRYDLDNDINFCMSVTCVQAGAFDIQELESLQKNVALITGIAGIRPATGSDSDLKTGESITRIRSAWADRRMDCIAANVHTVVSLRERPFDDFALDLKSTTAYRLGDGLISMMGQAVDPVDFACSAASGPPYTTEPKSYDFPSCLESAIPSFLKTIDKAPQENSSDILIHATINGRKYYFATRAAHTDFQMGFFGHLIDEGRARYETTPYQIAYYEPSVVVGESAVLGVDYKAAHPLQYFIDKVLVEPTSTVPRPGEVKITGVFRIANASIYNYQMLEPVVTLISATTGAETGARRKVTVAPDGSFELDAGALARWQFGQSANLLDYLVRIQVGDGHEFQLLLANAGPLRNIAWTYDLGELTLYRVQQGPMLNSFAGSVLPSANSAAPLAGADVWMALGSGLSAIEVRALSVNSQTGRRLITGADGSFAGDGFSPGVYTVVASKDGYEPSTPKSFALGTAPITLALTPNAGPNTVLFDDFNGTAIDTTKWTVDGWTATGNDYTGGLGSGVGPVTVANGLVEFGRVGRISTKGKVTFSGDGPIVIEGRTASTGALHDTSVMLIDSTSGDQILVGETNYAGWGFYAIGIASYKLISGNVSGDASNPYVLGSPTTAFMEYRITLDGNSIKIERGPTLANITQTGTATLGQSIKGRAFHVSIGAAWAYYPATWDWIRVKALPGAPSAGLVGHWSFDNCNGRDAGPNALHGTVTGTPACVDGRNGKALRLNGASTWITAPTSPAMPSSALTMSFWLHREGQALSFLENYLSKEQSFQAYLLGNRTSQFGIYHGGTGLWTGWGGAETALPALDGWVHYAFTYDNATRLANTYVNGTLAHSVLETNPNAALRASGQPLFIGRNGSANVYHVKGLLDEVRVYNRALSAAEVGVLAR